MHGLKHAPDVQHRDTGQVPGGVSALGCVVAQACKLTA